MRLLLAITGIGFVALQGTVSAGPPRACAQVSSLVEEAIVPLLAGAADPPPDTTQLRAQFIACLRSHNICTVLNSTQYGKEALLAGDVTADLPAQSEQGKSSVILLVRSIPHVGNDANEYCLVSEKSSGGTSAQQWEVHGWVLAPNASEVLPLPTQGLDYKAASQPTSLRGLAAALWFFAERMSGRPPPYEKSSQ